MLRIVEETVDMLGAHGLIPIAFEVASRFAIEPDDAGGFRLAEVPVPERWIKDESDDDRPEGLPARWDLTNWSLLAAYEGDLRVGGAIIAYDNPEVWFLDGRSDIACIDLRIAPEYRRQGIGGALLATMVEWARERDCVLLRIESQDTNVAAGRLYEAMGCRLARVDQDAYEDSDEVRLIWEFDITASPR